MSQKRDFGRPEQWTTPSLVVGIAGLVVLALGLVLGLNNGDNRPWLSLLMGSAFWISLLIGSLLMVMISYVFDAGWSVIIRRQLEHVISGFPWLALIFLPLILLPWLSENPGLIWKWLDTGKTLSDGQTVGEDPLFLVKSSYLNLNWMTLRTLLYFGVFISVALLLRRYSFQLDKDGDTVWVHRARRMSAIGIFAVGFALTFASVDWFMSLEYHWFSTMYGVWFFSSSIRAAVALTIVLCFWLSTKGHLQGIYQQAHRYNLGCLLLAFTVFWAYIAFSQMFLIYQGNIPEETFWYTMRVYNDFGEGTNPWWYVSLALIFLHFIIPFVLLLFYATKVSVKLLLGLSIWALIMHLVDLYYNILPGKIMSPAGEWAVRSFSVTPFDVAALVGIGGIVLWSMLRSMRQAAPIPVKDPRILESLHYHE